jgi:hypothetical protein
MLSLERILPDTWLLNDETLIVTTSATPESRILAYHLVYFEDCQLLELGAEGNA